MTFILPKPVTHHHSDILRQYRKFSYNCMQDGKLINFWLFMFYVCPSILLTSWLHLITHFLSSFKTISWTQFCNFTKHIGNMDKFIPINYCLSCNGPVALFSVLSHIFLNQISFSKFLFFDLVFFQIKILHIIYYEYITHNPLFFAIIPFSPNLKILHIFVYISSGSWILLIYHRYLCA